MQGKNENIYFDKNGYVNAAEMYATLFRLSDGKYSADSKLTNFKNFEIKKDYESWAAEPWEWAVACGIAETNCEISADGYNIFYRIASDVRRGRFLDSLPSKYDDKRPTYRVNRDDAFAPATRSDVILTLYYYMTTYYGVSPVSDRKVDLDAFGDWQKNCFVDYSVGVDGNVAILRPSEDEFEAAWEWAVGVGIAEGYPDGTLGIGSVSCIDDRIITDRAQYVTRAEYATILDRFVKYLENDAKVWLLISDDAPIIINAEGETLELKNGELYGNMEVYDENPVETGSIITEYFVTVKFSRNFTWIDKVAVDYFRK